MPRRNSKNPPDGSHPGDLVFWRIVEGTASATGEEFFRALVQNLAKAMGVYGAFLTEFYPEHQTARTLAFWTEDRWIEDYEYPIAGTPCEIVFNSGEFLHIEDRVAELFPADLDFKDLGIASYMGEPFRGVDGRVIGHLSVIDTKPLPEESKCTALFQIFAARAAAERKRLDAEGVIRQREEKLARVFEGTMDAIIELDHERKITQFNSAASEMFGCKAGYALGADFTDLIAPDSQAAFSALSEQLSAGLQGRRAAWIREGFHARRGDGTHFPAEASLSCSRSERDLFFTVVLRNVEDRIRIAAKIRALSEESEQLRAEVESFRRPGEIIGESPALRKVFQAIDQVAAADTTVLLTGETGTGKEVIARAIHAASRRADKPLIRVNCAAMPANLIESEFFGHEKGAFTGASTRREGRFSLADGGTIFLDEIGELPIELQPKLLRVLQEGEFEPVGSSHSRKVDVRVVAATNRDLKKEIAENRFREDLFYRLSVFPIHIPPLRERGKDVVLLAEAFGCRLASEMGKSFSGLSDRCRDLLASYPWPGNVRELQNVIERALLSLSASGHLDLATALPPSGPRVAVRCPDSEPPADAILRDADLKLLERNNMIRALEKCEWRISGEDGAAALIGIKPSTMTSRMKAFSIEKPAP